MKKNKIPGSMRCQCCGDFCQVWEYDKYCGKRITGDCDQGSELWFEYGALTKDELRSCWVGGMYNEHPSQEAILSWNHTQRVLELWNMKNRKCCIMDCYNVINKDFETEEDAKEREQELKELINDE